jgi:hypothetical protein
MKPLFVNDLSSSFMLFLDHEICSKGDAFVNTTSGKLYPSSDGYFTNKKIYQSSYRQWISDSSIPSALIPSGIYVGSNFIPKGTSGLQIDYGMGRVFFDSGMSPSLNNITSDFSYKEFNLFLTAKDEAQLFLDDPVSSYAITGAISPILEPFPLIYVKNYYGINNPFAFGGMDESVYEFRCTVLADNPFKLDSLNSILQDSARKSFPFINSSGLPFNIYGDFKSGISEYKYTDYYASNPELIYIESVRVSKFDERVNKLIKEGVWGGFIDFKLIALRHPRI